MSVFYYCNNLRNPTYRDETKSLPGIVSSMMPNWHHLDPHSEIHNDFENTLNDRVDGFAWFSQILVDYFSFYGLVNVVYVVVCFLAYFEIF